MSKITKKAVVYANSMEGENANTSALEAVMNFATENGYTITNIYLENPCQIEAPALQKMATDSAHGEFETILIPAYTYYCDFIFNFNVNTQKLYENEIDFIPVLDELDYQGNTEILKSVWYELNLKRSTFAIECENSKNEYTELNQTQLDILREYAEHHHNSKSVCSNLIN